jgi:hypothetical protein
MSISEPHTDVCSNSGYDARFTTPCCYYDLDVDAQGEGEATCPECGRKVICSYEQEPKSVCRLASEDDE